MIAYSINFCYKQPLPVATVPRLTNMIYSRNTRDFYQQILYIIRTHFCVFISHMNLSVLPVSANISFPNGGWKSKKNLLCMKKFVNWPKCTSSNLRSKRRDSYKILHTSFETLAQWNDVTVIVKLCSIRINYLGLVKMVKFF